MTNSGLPPVLSRSRHQIVADAAEALKNDLDALLADVDAALAEATAEQREHGTPAAA